MLRIFTISILFFSLTVIAANKKTPACDKRVQAAISLSLGQYADQLSAEETLFLQKMAKDISSGNLVKVLNIYRSVKFMPSSKMVPRTPQVGLTLAEAKELLPVLDTFPVADLQTMALNWFDANSKQFRGRARDAGKYDNQWRLQHPKKIRSVFRKFLSDVNISISDS